jgi:hypothetical protein
MTTDDLDPAEQFRPETEVTITPVPEDPTAALMHLEAEVHSIEDRLKKVEEELQHRA